MKIKHYSLCLACMIWFAGNSFGQEQISLSEKFQNDKIRAVNRSISIYDGHSNAIEMNAENSSGLGIIQDMEFETGIVEIDILGENNPGKSFVGIAFNIQDDETYEAIYFRPFNFVAEEQIRKEHMVQYIHHPEFTWRKLREEKTGEFENKIPNPPNPDDWFKAIIHIKEKEVEVYLDGRSEPILIVERLTAPKSKTIGVWTGYGSSGRFRDLIVR